MSLPSSANGGKPAISTMSLRELYSRRAELKKRVQSLRRAAIVVEAGLQRGHQRRASITTTAAAAATSANRAAGDVLFHDSSAMLIAPASVSFVPPTAIMNESSSDSQQQAAAAVHSADSRVNSGGGGGGGTSITDDHPVMSLDSLPGDGSSPFPYSFSGQHQSNQQSNEQQQRPSDNKVFAAVLTEDAEYLYYLLNRGADPNCRDFKERTPLHIACFTGDLAAVELLVEFGADVNAVDGLTQTPRELALINSHYNIIAYLDPGRLRQIDEDEEDEEDEEEEEDNNGGDQQYQQQRQSSDFTTQREGSDSINAQLTPTRVGRGAEMDPFAPPSSSLLNSIGQQNEPRTATPSAAAAAATTNSASHQQPLRPGGHHRSRSQNISLDSQGGFWSGGGSPRPSDGGGATTAVPMSSTPPPLTATASGKAHHHPHHHHHHHHASISAARRSLLGKVNSPSNFVTIGDTESVVVCMVGLPGRGKSFLSKNCCRFLRWKGIPARVFNAGDYRRRILGAEETRAADFFNPHNPKGREQRERMAQLACEDAARFIRQHAVAVAFIDATNTNCERRQWLLDFFAPVVASGVGDLGHKVLFIESVCDDDDVITDNIVRDKVSTSEYVGDYRGVPTEQVVQDFHERILQYRRQYETMDLVRDEALSFLKIINLKQTIMANRIRGRLMNLIAALITNLHPVAHPLYIVVPRGRPDEAGAATLSSMSVAPEIEQHVAPAITALVKQMCERDKENLFHVVFAGQDPSCERAVSALLNPSFEGGSAAAAAAVVTGKGGAGASGEAAAAAAASSSSPSTAAGGIPQNLVLLSSNELRPLNMGLCEGGHLEEAQREWGSLMDNIYVPRCAEPQRGRPVQGEAALYQMILGRPLPPPRQQEAAATSAGGGAAAAASVASSLPSSPATAGPPTPNAAPVSSSVPSAVADKPELPVLPSSASVAQQYVSAYPKGESLRTVAVRVLNIILHWKRCRGPVLCVCSAAPAQLLAAFAGDLPPEYAPHLHLPRDSVIEITTKHNFVIRPLIPE